MRVRANCCLTYPELITLSYYLCRMDCHLHLLTHVFLLFLYYEGACTGVFLDGDWRLGGYCGLGGGGVRELLIGDGLSTLRQRNVGGGKTGGKGGFLAFATVECIAFY